MNTLVQASPTEAIAEEAPPVTARQDSTDNVPAPLKEFLNQTSTPSWPSKACVVALNGNLVAERTASDDKYPNRSAAGETTPGIRNQESSNLVP